MTFREFADICQQRHAVAKNLSLAQTIDWRVRPILERFGDCALTDITTADIETSSPTCASRASSAGTPKSVASLQPQSTAPSNCCGTC